MIMAEGSEKEKENCWAERSQKGVKGPVEKAMSKLESWVLIYVHSVHDHLCLFREDGIYLLSDRMDICFFATWIMCGYPKNVWQERTEWIAQFPVIEVPICRVWFLWSLFFLGVLRTVRDSVIIMDRSMRFMIKTVSPWYREVWELLFGGCISLA